MDAFEGGSNYWCGILGYRLVDGISMSDVRAGGRFNNKEYYHPSQIVPLLPDSAVKVLDKEDDGKIHLLDREKLHRGLIILARKYPTCWNAIVGENYDCDDADSFLQCCLFGEIRYG